MKILSGRMAVIALVPLLCLCFLAAPAYAAAVTTTGPVGELHVSSSGYRIEVGTVFYEFPLGSEVGKAVWDLAKTAKKDGTPLTVGGNSASGGTAGQQGNPHSGTSGTLP